jgi:succinate dehydrogenase/fumarate reductase flavoprotein subunit
VPYKGTFAPGPAPVPTHIVFDEEFRLKGALYPAQVFGTLKLAWSWWAAIERYQWSADSSVEIARGWIVKADTLADLAVKIKKDPVALQKTVTTWNEYVAAGKDPEYGRAATQMAAIQTPPYYAAEFVPTFVNTQGGPRRNKDAQIVDLDGNPIPRLYSAGELGSIYSFCYQGGGNVGECMAFGRIAGNNAASESSWS